MLIRFMKKLQIAVKVDDWDGSVLYAVGRQLNGRQLVPVGIVARDLPEPWLTVWHGLVKQLRGVAPGEWAATYISAELTTLPLPEDAPEDTAPQQAVALVVRRRWDDGTTAEPVELVLEAPEAVAFFDIMTC